MRIGPLPILTVLVALWAYATQAQDQPAPTGTPMAPSPMGEVVTERLAEPYTVDLMPDEPVVLTPREPGPGTESAPPQPAWRRKTVTGDLFDRLLSTKELGVTFGGRITQFGFGNVGGVNRPVPPPLGRGNAFTYTGRGEYDLLFDLEKFGGLPKGRLLVRAEHWYGEYGGASLRAGTFTPSIFPALLPPRPNDPGVPYITNFLFTQPLSPKLVVFAGKKDVLGSFDQDIFAGGDGTDQFVNQAFIANPAFLLGMPYTSFTAGFVSPQEWGGIGGFVYDPKNRTADFMNFGDLFARGIIVGGELKVRTKFFDLPGQQHIGGIWKHDSQNDLRSDFGIQNGSAEAPPAGNATIRDSFTIYYGCDQYLVRFTENPDRGWGLFGRAAITDGNPNPVRYFLSAGIGGFSPLGEQRGDTFGLGWYFVGASNQFGPIPTALLGPRDGTGIEAYYNFQATPWLNITPDLQWLRPGLGAISSDNAFLYGLRVNFTF